MPTRNKTYDKQNPKTTLAGGARRLAALDGKISESPAGKALTAISTKTVTLADGAKRLTVAIGREAAANFRAWFERNFANPRAGRIGGVSYARAGSLDDRRGDPAWYSDAYGRAFWDHTEPLTPDEEDYLRSHPLVMLQLALGVTDLRGLRCLRRGLTLRTNALQRKSYRSRYYAHDNARRRQLAAERRKIRRRMTLNPCPTPDEFRAAFARVKESAEAKIRFGGMVHDLACYVDSCLRYDENGNIVGRNGGIRAWIAENAPELSPRYKTIMRYKALAMRVRQLTGIKDPQPTSVLLDGQTGVENYSAHDSHFGKSRSGDAEGDGQKKEKSGAYGLERERDRMVRERDRMVRERDRMVRERDRMVRERDGMVRESNGLGRGPNGLERKRKQLRYVLAECRNTFKDVFDKIDSELG